MVVRTFVRDIRTTWHDVTESYGNVSCKLDVFGRCDLGFAFGCSAFKPEEMTSHQDGASPVQSGFTVMLLRRRLSSWKQPHRTVHMHRNVSKSIRVWNRSLTWNRLQVPTVFPHRSRVAVSLIRKSFRVPLRQRGLLVTLRDFTFSAKEIFIHNDEKSASFIPGGRYLTRHRHRW